MPIRIQRKRTAGWKMPENTISVTRPGRWGNPEALKGQTYTANASPGISLPVAAANAHAAFMAGVIARFHAYAVERVGAESAWLAPLRGKNLACWCKLGNRCHADVLLEILAEIYPEDYK